MGLVLAFLSAIVYGCADFCGGKSTRKAASSTVTFSSQLAGLVVLGAALFFVPGEGPSLRVLSFGALGGLGGAVGILLLYHGLAVGTMSIVSPVAAVTAATIPVAVGTAILGERPGWLPLVGIAFALTAIALVSLSGGGGPTPHSARFVFIALGAGIGFGLFFVFLQRAGDPKVVGLWGLVGARPVSIAVSGLLATRQHEPLFPSRAAWPLVALAGVLDQLANVLYVLSIGHGLLSLLAVLASLYPVSTVGLARVIDGERLRPVQVAGLGFALLGLVLIAV